MRAMGYRSKPSHAGFFRLLLVAAQNSDDDAACTALSKLIGQRGRLTRLLKMLFLIKKRESADSLFFIGL